MASSTEGRAVDRHDWHSPGYVDEWIARDRQRDEERRKCLRDMLSYPPYPANAEIAVLDVGGGYGVVSEEVLRAFPCARVTLQDYSQPMLDRAKQRLASYGGQVQYAAGDLREPGWVRQVGGPFDLVVSAIAIHNLRDAAAIVACYRAIAGLVKADGVFLDYDLFDLIGGLDQQLRTIEDAGFAAVGCIWQQPPLAIIRAREPRGAA